MKLLITTNGRLYKHSDGHYYTDIVYGYGFFQRYFDVFEKIKLVAFTEALDDEEKLSGMIRVDGPNLEIFEMPFPHGKIGHLLALPALIWKTKSATSKCDAALFRVPDILAYILYLGCKLRKMPIGLEVTSNPIELNSKESGQYPFRTAYKMFDTYMLKWICRKSDGVSYVTKAFLQSIYPSGVKTNNANRFETFYTDANINLSKDATCRKYTAQTHFTLLIVSASYTGYVKGHKELIEAYIQLKKKGYDITLKIVGSGTLAEDIQEKLSASGYEDDVIFTGELHIDELNECYRTSDIFVFPSYREGLPRVLIEAMSFGLPCVTSNIPGCLELVSEKMTVPVKDSASLVGLLEHLITHSDMLESESERNLNTAKKYSIDLIRGKRIEYYKFLYDCCIK